MSTTTDLSVRQKAAGIVILMAVLGLLVSTGLLLREHAPGNMGGGFLLGAGLGLVAAAVLAWRVSKGRGNTFERAWTQTGDERDDALLTRSLAVLGLAAFPATGVAAIAVGLGAGVSMVFTLLLATEVAVLGIAFLAASRRS